MLKHAANLSSSNEYFIVWAGGTSARPWGSKAEAYALFPELELAGDGMSFTGDFSAGGHATSTQSTFTATATTQPGANEFVGATLRMGSNTAALQGYGVVDANTVGSLSVDEYTFSVTVTWTIGLTGETGSTADACYVVHEGRKWGSYPQVRVLTPYQGVTSDDSITDAVLDVVAGGAFTADGRSLTLPTGYSGTTTAADHDDVGVLLPLSFHEGIDGWGISDKSDSEGTAAHTIDSVVGSTWTFNNPVTFDDLLNGGYVIVDWETGGAMKRSWAPITDSTQTTFVVGTWVGDGDPAASANVKRYTAWVPHYNDSPYAYLPGEGFTYPNHDPMPCSSSAIGANVHCRPRGLTGNAYGDTFGGLLVAASRLAAATGKRVNVVNLGATDAMLEPSNSRNPYGFQGQLGWWDHKDHGTWAPHVSTSLYARLDKLLRTVLPNAMLAEANTKSLKCLGIVFAHGETDAVSVQARQNYGKAQRLLIDTLRRLIDDLGYNPYAYGAKIPYVQPRVAHLPYELDGSYARHADRQNGAATMTYDGDKVGLVNSAIEENTAADAFATAVRVDDLPRDTTDPGLYTGAGEAALGGRIGDALAVLVNYGLGFGSAVLDATQTRVVDICNLALAHIGDAGQITSLSDGSEQATLCNRFLPEARDELLQSLPWGFAMRRRQLVAVRTPEARLFQNWRHCFVVPAEAMYAFKVLPPVDMIYHKDFDYTDVTGAAYAATFNTNDGGMTLDTATLGVAGQNPLSTSGIGGALMDTQAYLPVLTGSEMKPQPFHVEQSPFGHRYIYTNQDQATLQYVARVADADLYAPLFASALSYNLASKLAPVIIKGDAGETVAARMRQTTAGYLNSAAASDANQQLDGEGDGPFQFTPDHLHYRDGYSPDGSPRGDITTYPYPSGFSIR